MPLSLLPGRNALAFARLPLDFPVSALQAELRSLPKKAWQPHVNRRDYEGVWDVLPLRCQGLYAAAHPVLQAFFIEAQDGYEDLAFLQRMPTARRALQSLGCPLKSARLMRLKPQGEIRPHRDPGLCIEQGEARLHLPIFTSAHVSFSVGGMEVPMRAGELWYINADVEHAASNRGTGDRIHLVIDCIANEWLVGQLSLGSDEPSRLNGQGGI